MLNELAEKVPLLKVSRRKRFEYQPRLSLKVGKDKEFEGKGSDVEASNQCNDNDELGKG